MSVPARAVDQLTTSERLGEIAALLAQAVLRLETRHAEQVAAETVRLDFPSAQSVSPDRCRPRRPSS